MDFRFWTGGCVASRHLSQLFLGVEDARARGREAGIGKLGNLLGLETFEGPQREGDALLGSEAPECRTNDSHTFGLRIGVLGTQP